MIDQSHVSKPKGMKKGLPDLRFKDLSKILLSLYSFVSEPHCAVH